MHPRTQAREEALKLLYLLDQWGELSALASRMRSYFSEAALPDAVRNYTEALVRGTAGHLCELDALIRRASAHWETDRMSIVDRNLLRLALYEICYVAEVPDAVSIDEAVELGKKYGGPKTGPFINGVLDAVRKVLRADTAKVGETM
ncbi:MAG: transcription antitermination factor NusB [Candidatus Schekmanbacteria bacterium]|nr:transcription antitermination factor NusB [Candidatus Schekmanbacteria bacterium]